MHPASEPARCDPQPRERLDSGDVGVDDRADVAEDQVGVARAQQRTDVVAQPGHVAARHRAAEDQDDRARFAHGQQMLLSKRRLESSDRRLGRKSSPSGPLTLLAQGKWSPSRCRSKLPPA